MQLPDQLILFTTSEDSLLSGLCAAFAGQCAGAPLVGRLVNLAVQHGWQGNLWHCLLASTLAEHTNAFSLACERREAVKDSLYALALLDMEIYRQLFAYTPEDCPGADILCDFRHGQADEAICALARTLAQAKSAQELLGCLTAFYRDNGLGMLGLGKIFRVHEQDGLPVLYPVTDSRRVCLSDLVGYESQKAQLLENTLAFLHGHHSNNVLLYGDAGTGKSTSVQAIANEYACDGLRLIELYKNQFGLIPDILAQIKNRNYRFILFLDDLSFEENEIEYKHLKAVMEGGAEAAPENVLIYATSNRRHLIRETWNDRSDMQHDGDIHRSDTMEEKLSLAARFGLQIYYPNPSFEEYHTIVRALADRSGAAAELTEEQLRAAASTWQVRKGSRSGRSAQQFINDLLCRVRESET